ncbi:MarR family transcriptional regulator [Paenibacillus chitinolyticus]|uniref:MarR family winged helix-turn-helix transcriptional regulator n=1 Tax=Paenibacillus chitinolyticus TaxID=79263 RepID=UPI002DB8C55B|nr:MarR family transcriptional regulator [Paenibacillus chitinolyticus]MEC0245180.1 MarR family transcriptional regulator [Paenibacillus chitinolyticus]
MEKNRTSQTNNGTGHNNGGRSLGRLILQLRRLERRPQTFGSAGPLTPSEIHTIEAIGTEGGILMSELAGRLEITKGAVTQLIVRLETKDLVVRSPHPEDSRGTLISLTGKGKDAHAAHEEVHRAFYDQLQEQLTEQEIEVFDTCIEKLITLLKK